MGLKIVLFALQDEVLQESGTPTSLDLKSRIALHESYRKEKMRLRATIDQKDKEREELEVINY